jgi:hypothetical protein
VASTGSVGATSVSPRVEQRCRGTTSSMTDRPSTPDPAQGGPEDAQRDLAEHERPEVGLIADEDLPEDLQPTDDNPLAKDPGEDEDDSRETSEPKVEGMPDMGGPGAPA